MSRIAGRGNGRPLSKKDWQRGSTGLVAAMALVQSLILLAVVVAGQALQRERA